MSLPPAAPRCLHCDSTLGHRELVEGWCDSCGKRLPAATTSIPGAPRAAETPVGRVLRVVWAAALFIGVGAAAVVAMAYRG